MSRRAAAPDVASGCCAGVLEVRVGYTIFARHTLRSRLFVRFFWRFLLISLLCCLFCIVSQATRILFVRSASRWSIGEQGQIILRFPAPRLLFNGAHFHSHQVRGFPRLLHCEQFVQQSRCFLQRRAPPLPIIETQKSPCERCGLTRFTL